MMDQNILSEIENKIKVSYHDTMPPMYCAAMKEALAPLITENTVYRIPLISWLVGQEFDDITVTRTLGEDAGENACWSLKEIAGRINPKIPNVPAAVLLFFLAEETPLTIEYIFLMAEQFCYADPVLLEQDDAVCTLALLDKSVWYFFAENSSDQTQMQSCQLWQVLLQYPELIDAVSDDTLPDGASVSYQDGAYEIYTGEEGEFHETV